MIDTLRNNLAQWIKEEGLSVNKVEQRIGTKYILARFLDGSKGLNVTWLCKIIDEYGVAPEKFFK